MKKTNYIQYAWKAKNEKQHLYIDRNACAELIEELLEKNVRRILIVCSNATRKLKAFDNLIDELGDKGFRVFVYCLSERYLIDRDVLGAIKIYREYSCNTVLTVGSSAETDCGKLVSALIGNPHKTLPSITGANLLKHNSAFHCCVVTEDIVSSSMASAEYMEESTGTWKTVMSNKLVPNTVVFDTDFLDRASLGTFVLSTVSSLCTAMEAYVNPLSFDFPEYRACAVTSCNSTFKYLEALCEDPADTFLRMQVAIGGFYSGLAARKMGYGYAHIIMHTLISEYGITHGSLLDKILPLTLAKLCEDNPTILAQLAKDISICPVSLPDDEASELLIEKLNELFAAIKYPDNDLRIDDKQIPVLMNKIQREASTYSFGKQLDTETISLILKAL